MMKIYKPSAISNLSKDDILIYDASLDKYVLITQVIAEDESEVTFDVDFVENTPDQFELIEMDKYYIEDDILTINE